MTRPVKTVKGDEAIASAGSRWEQSDSGLGLGAQRRSVSAFCDAHGFRVIESFRDVESGKHDQRPGLRPALAKAKAAGATIVIAKLERLSRNVAFIMTLRESGVPFIAADMPEANTMTIGIMAVMAQAEREAINTRTKAALGGISEEAPQQEYETRDERI